MGIDLKRVAVAFHIGEEANGVQTRESNVCSIVAALARVAMAVGMAVGMALVWATMEPRYRKTDVLLASAGRTTKTYITSHHRVALYPRHSSVSLRCRT